MLQLRKKAINEENGTRSRRAKSCGNGKGSKLLSQRSANGERNAKEKFRKTFSCPEPNKERRSRTWENLTDDDFCRDTKRKSIVKEPSNKEHKHSYDGSKVTTIKRKRCKADVQLKVSKKLRKSKTAGHFSSHDNTLSQPDVGEADGSRARKRKRNSARGKLFSNPIATIDQFSDAFDYLSDGSCTDEVPNEIHTNEN